MKKLLAILLCILLLTLTACVQVGTHPTETSGDPATQPTVLTKPSEEDVSTPTETIGKEPDKEESVEDIKARIEPVKRSFTYDEKGNLIRVCGDNGETEYIAEYDEQGRIVGEEDYYNGEPITDSSYEYFPDGGWKKIHYGTGGNTENTYDAQGKLLLSISYESYRAEYTYNEQGDVIRMKESYDPAYYDGEQLYTYEYEYDEKDNWVKKTVCRNGELDQYFLHTYNEVNQLTDEYEYYATGEEAWHEIYSYDEENRLAETLCYGKDELLYITTYHYNKDGRLFEERTYYVDN